MSKFQSIPFGAPLGLYIALFTGTCLTFHEKQVLEILEITPAMWAEPATTGEGGDYLGDEPDSKNASTLHFDISEMDYSM